MDIVTDEEILAAQRWLSANEGIFVEPASAASVAGLMKITRGESCAQIPAGQRIVLTVTGHGLKDPEAVTKGGVPIAPIEAEATSEAILAAIS